MAHPPPQYGDIFGLTMSHTAITTRAYRSASEDFILVFTPKILRRLILPPL